MKRAVEEYVPAPGNSQSAQSNTLVKIPVRSEVGSASDNASCARRVLVHGKADRRALGGLRGANGRHRDRISAGGSAVGIRLSSA